MPFTVFNSCFKFYKYECLAMHAVNSDLEVVTLILFAPGQTYKIQC